MCGLFGRDSRCSFDEAVRGDSRVCASFSNEREAIQSQVLARDSVPAPGSGSALPAPRGLWERVSRPPFAGTEARLSPRAATAYGPLRAVGVPAGSVAVLSGQGLSHMPPQALCPVDG